MPLIETTLDMDIFVTCEISIIDRLHQHFLDIDMQNGTCHAPTPTTNSRLKPGGGGGGATWRTFTRMCVLKVWKRTHFEGNV